VGGDEECPEGVAVLITPNAPDVLSHVSVRARNCNVLFATCYDAATLEDWRQLENKLVTVGLPNHLPIQIRVCTMPRKYPYQET
jgi:hypothetical protein